MTFLSSAIGRARPSATVAITQRAREMAAAGRDVISLSAGEPDFPTPEHVRAAAIAAIERGETRYTAPDGIAELKAAIARKLTRENGVETAPDRVIVSTGGKQAIFNALLATVEPGDEVVFAAPYWVSYPDIVALFGGTPVAVPTAAEGGFKMTPDALAAALSPRTKWVILNSPGNPSGAGYSSDELAALAEPIGSRPGVHVLSDEIYEHVAYPPFAFASFAAAAPALAGRTLTVNGVSKGHAMTGWRIGYAAGPKPLIDAMRLVQGQSTTNPCSIAQHAALAALDGPQDHIAERRDAFRRRRDAVVAALNAAPGLACPTPEGAFYVFPSCAGAIGRTSRGGARIADDEAFCAALLEETGVATVPGSAFGASPHFRISYALDDAALAEACARIAGFCEGLA